MASLLKAEFAGAKVSAKVTRGSARRTAVVTQAAKKVVKKAPKKVAKKGGAKSTGKWGAGTDFGSDNSKAYGPSRKLYLPGGIYSYSELPSYLNGELAGDYGYDPLALGTDKATVTKYREFEVLHARWAMLGVAGMIIPEGLAANGADIPGASWVDSGKVLLDGLSSGETMNYFAVPWVNLNNPLPLPVVAVVQIGLMGAAENYRTAKTGPKGYAPGVGAFDESVFNGLDTLNPGGPFDPFGLADDPTVFAELKTKEIKNGRLAMMAFLGFVLQAAATGEGPYTNWAKHVSDPFGYNLFTVLTSDRTLTL